MWPSESDADSGAKVRTQADEEDELLCASTQLYSWKAYAGNRNGALRWRARATSPMYSRTGSNEERSCCSSGS